MSQSGLSGQPRLRRAAAVLAVATVTSLVAPLPATAGLAATPTITTPTNGATVVSSPMLVSATSEAAFVRFVAAGQVERTVAVSGGSAVTELSVHGLMGSTLLEAFDCDSLVSCGADADSITVDVQLTPPEITEPSRNDVVGTTVTVRAKAPKGGAIRFFVDGAPVGKDSDPPYTKQISLKDRKDGEHVLAVQQCNSNGSICDGGTDAVRVLKDTRGPKFTDVDSSLGTVYPVKDNYKDAVKLSARVGEKSLGTKVEIRKSGGPLVRTINLGREDAGRVSVSWNGRKSNGNIVSKGKYLFRFVGTDVHGVVGKSNDKVIHVSDQKLVKKKVTKTVSGWGSKVSKFAGTCSSVVRIGSSTVGLRSNSRGTCSGDGSIAATMHAVSIGKAKRYGNLKVSMYGRGVTRNAPTALMANVLPSGQAGARTRLGGALRWTAGDSVSLKRYLSGGKIYWLVVTGGSNSYNAIKFRVSYTVTVLK